MEAILPKRRLPPGLVIWGSIAERTSQPTNRLWIGICLPVHSDNHVDIKSSPHRVPFIYTRMMPASTPDKTSVQPFPFLDLKVQYRTIKAEIDAAIERVMESQHFILGPEVESFEKEIAACTQTQVAVACASGS